MSLLRRLLFAGLLGLLIVTPALGESCADVLEWRGVIYEGLYEERNERSREPAFAGQLATSAIDTCSGAESSGCRGDEGESVDVFRLRGVDPEIAFGVRSRLSRVYLAPGYFIRLRSHPLHDAIYGRGAEDPPTDEYRRWSCRRPLEVAATVANADPWYLSLRFEGDQIRRDTSGETHVAVDVKTTVRGQTRNALPYVEEGDRILARVRECTSRGRYAVVADEIRVESG